MKTDVYILQNDSSRRLKYVCDFIFEQLAQCQCQYVTSVKDLDEKAVIINYGHTDKDVGFRVKPYGLLHIGEMQRMPFSDFDFAGIPADFDVFSFVFFHLSRMEEYGVEGDAHGRYTYKGSWSQSRGTKGKPIADLVIELFFKRLNASFDRKVCEVRTAYKPVMSIDVDQLYSYRRKGVSRNLGGYARDIMTLRWQRVLDRFRVTVLSGHDPYDQLPWMTENCQNRNVETFLFYLVDSKSSFDKQIELLERDFTGLEGIELGLHPSYASGLDHNQIHHERVRLNTLSGRDIKQSRFHYLKMRLPDSYIDLMKAGISSDYTMMWSDFVGFRSGTCHPHYFYNLHSESECLLKIFPTIAMDVVLKNNLALKPESVRETIQEFTSVCKELHGTCIFLWHNSSFDKTEGWSGWQKVFLEILDDMVAE